MLLLLTFYFYIISYNIPGLTKRNKLKPWFNIKHFLLHSITNPGKRFKHLLFSWNIHRFNFKTLSMKPINTLFSVFVLLFVFQASNVSAQLGAANVAAHGVLALMGGSRQDKQEKIIDQSITQEKISGSNVTVLRVKESDIKSKAKKNIIALQNRLSQYNAQYKNNQPLDIPKNDSDLIAIQNIDENWPTEYYTGELRAYKRYAFQQKQKAPAVPVDSIHVTPAPVNKDTTSTKL